VSALDWKERIGRKLGWRVDESATLDDLTTDGAGLAPPGGGGRVVFVDHEGRARRLPANLDELSREERDAALAAMSQALGGPPPDAARTAAIERLTELRAAGRLSEADFRRERKRLEGLG
jgi:hypothetical protein